MIEYIGRHRAANLSLTTVQELMLLRLENHEISNLLKARQGLKVRKEGQ